MRKKTQSMLDDYQFLGDVETGFSTSNPMISHITSSENDNSVSSSQFGRIYNHCIIIFCAGTTIMIGVVVYLVASKII